LAIRLSGYQAIRLSGNRHTRSSISSWASVFKVAGEEAVVRAKNHTLGGFSAHASQSQLLDRINNLDNHPKLYLVHDEAETKQKFRTFLAEKGWAAEILELNESIHF
jgi:metallo-beta-lactamase family protein